MPQSPHRLRNDLKCVEWDVKPYTTNQPTPASPRLIARVLSATRSHTDIIASSRRIALPSSHAISCLSGEYCLSTSCRKSQVYCGDPTSIEHWYLSCTADSACRPSWVLRKWTTDRQTDGRTDGRTWSWQHDTPITFINNTVRRRHTMQGLFFFKYSRLIAGLSSKHFWWMSPISDDMQ